MPRDKNVVNPKQSVVEEIAALLEPLKKLQNETLKKCEELSEKHGIPFRLGPSKAYFPDKIDRTALVGTEFDWMIDWGDRLPYEGEGWDTSYC